jgi:hypothetical protein
VYNGGTYIQIAELNFQTCGSDKTSSDHTMASNAPVVIDLDKQDVLSFVTTASNGGNAAVHLEVMSGSTSWAYTEAWKCKWWWMVDGGDSGDRGDSGDSGDMVTAVTVVTVVLISMLLLFFLSLFVLLWNRFQRGTSLVLGVAGI